MAGEGQCPFTKQKCIRERCELWASVPVVQRGPLVGSARQAVADGCIFQLMPLVIDQNGQAIAAVLASKMSSRN